MNGTSGSRPHGPHGTDPHRVVLSLEPPGDVLVPGGGALRLEVGLRNQGPEVEQIELHPVGPLAAWTVLEEPVVRIWPQEQARIGLSVQIPPGPDVPAGPSVLALAGRTGDGVLTDARAPVDIAVHVEIGLPVPEPHAIETPRLAEVGLRLDNRSNVPVQVTVTATDREGRLRQRRPRSPFGLPPGGSSRIALGLACRKPIWRGRSRPHEYTVRAEVLPQLPAGSAAPAEPAAPSVTGVLVQAPLLRIWWLLLWLVLVVAAWATWADGGFALLLLILLILGWSGFLLARLLHGLLVVRRRRAAAAPARSFPTGAGP